MARQDWETVDRLLNELNRLGWEGGSQTISAAFALAVDRRFYGQGLQRIAQFVRETRARYQEGDTLPALEMEGMIRAALGEADPVDDIDPEAALSAQIAILATLLQDANFTESQLEEFIKEVEEVAAEHM
ncbi:hypothetical protein [Micromonospora polyrhachis]|uniref:Uncharacterized protein n=1 Tax=Micromonospora polyrhachis TaxID=1282883 RepID=A0A7W7SNX8_9ACTN|nr:hypothetical protein [Micromonospora polyrhachis]MBB4957896.1 hypothetical protein [Micromonospora polyrhachis]